MNVKDSVLERYSEGAREVQPSLCCPVSYDPALLDQLPDEIIDKDYGCGDPSAYVRPGDTVLDLGSGGGKICYIAAQLVGKQGKVIGVDMNDDMLKLARKYQSEMAKKIGYHNTVFHKGHIQDLAIDLERMHTWLQNNPIQNTVDLDRLDAWKAGQRSNHPMIGDNSVDLVISNCVLNLVDDTLKTNLVQEIFRVLKPGGRIAISDIVSDELCPETLKHDPRLWSGCLSGAFQEKDFLDAFTRSGFISVMIDKWDDRPWQVIDDIEFRSVTVTAIKPSAAPCLDYGHAVIYRGPYAEITDDEGHIFPRGERMAVCERTFLYLTEGPHRDSFIGITPAQPAAPVTWCAPPGTHRPVHETRNSNHKTPSGNCC